MTEEERALFVRCFGVLEWICGEGLSPVDTKYPDPDDLFLDLVNLLGQEEYDALLAERANAA